MNEYIGYKLELSVTREQTRHFARSVGVSRYAYNWMLDRLITDYDSCKSLALMYDLDKIPSKRISSIDWHKEWVKLKSVEGFEWINDVSKCAGQMALRDLEKAYKRFFKAGKGYPRFKKKYSKDSYQVDGTVYLEKDGVGRIRVHIPRVGLVKLYEKNHSKLPEFDKLKLTSATISRQAGRWFVSFHLKNGIENKPLPKELSGAEITGIDLGIKDLAITSGGETFDNPKAYKSKLQRLKRYQRAYARKQKGSKNKQKARFKIARLHKRVADVRKDAVHKMTNTLTKTTSGIIVIESLKPKNMSKNRKLASSILDASFGMISLQLEYKCKREGIHLVKAHPFYPSSQLCSNCGHRYKELKLTERYWECRCCGTSHDRDYNAALNLQFYAEWFLDRHVKQKTVSSTGLACGRDPSAPGMDRVYRDERLQFLVERCSSEKQEFRHKFLLL